MPTLQEALEVFLDVPRREATNDQYRIVLGLMVKAIGPANEVRDISYEMLQRYQKNLRQQVQDSTVAGYTSVIKSFFNFCVRREYTPKSPAADLARIRVDRDPNSLAIPPDELERMVEYCRVTSPRNYAMILFLADTGCRVGGLVSLSRLHLHLDEFTAFLQEKGGIWARVDFGELTAEALAIWLKKRPECDHDFVWTGKAPRYEAIGRENVEYLVGSWSLKIGAAKKRHPHEIRHAVGHAWANAGVPAHVTKSKLNHAHLSTTIENYYPDADPYVSATSRHLSLIALKKPGIKTHGAVIDLDPVHRRQSGS